MQNALAATVQTGLVFSIINLVPAISSCCLASHGKINGN